MHKYRDLGLAFIALWFIIRILQSCSCPCRFVLTLHSNLKITSCQATKLKRHSGERWVSIIASYQQDECCMLLPHPKSAGSTTLLRHSRSFQTYSSTFAQLLFGLACSLQSSLACDLNLQHLLRPLRVQLQPLVLCPALQSIKDGA